MCTGRCTAFMTRGATQNCRAPARTTLADRWKPVGRWGVRVAGRRSWDMSACDASRRREEAWERLLGLERQVRELRQLLLADAWDDAEGVTALEVGVAPTSMAVRAPRLLDCPVTCLRPFGAPCGGPRPG